MIVYIVVLLQICLVKAYFFVNLIIKEIALCFFCVSIKIIIKSI